ncbi:LacI family DNA-binding transcriptional regulator [Rhizobium tumorigenes]|uniref:LacI family DNA-binding transcriptional regulator n=1 Tax=Rhizobium tumorigenes TaxID=2041385 RepID=A0AAF1KX60_9HYPH|nr:LacI family DNA-binding transcriptional regulator [Rhizobium tumorigenes]WFR99399.1 LacI family DNA-binding transcriptional regulator [Rhizobium tumorigenes]
MTTRRRLPDRKSKITLREVALRADVSESTVSRIMRNQSLVADATREKVMETVRALGYVPNRIAGSLASLNSHLIGVVIPSLSNIVFPEVIQGVHEALKSSDFQAVISTTEYDIDREEVMVRGLLAWKPAAILIAGFDHTMATRRMLDQSGVRVVELMDIDSAPIDIAVGMSHRKAGHAIGQHLIARGYRHFGYVGHDWAADRRARLRYDGLREALAEAGLSIEAHAIADGPSSVGTGRDQTKNLCATSSKIDVAVYSNDDMAVGGVFHCLSAGISLPDDMAIFGFNGLEIGRELPQPLSTLRSNRFMIGKKAIEAILESPERCTRPVVIDTGFEIFSGATA